MYNKNYPNYKLYLAGIITENQYYESIDVSEIWNQELPDNLKPLMISVGNYNRYSDKDTLFHLLPKYDDLNVQLDAHGLAKISRGFQLNSLIEMLKTNKAPNHTAPLISDQSRLGAGLGTGSGTAYRDGGFIVVAPFGKELKDGIKYIIVDGKFADIQPIEGKTATQILQQELGQGGKYEFIDGGENNNQLDAFFAKFPKPKSNKKQLKDKQPEVYSKPITPSKTSSWDEPPPIINSLF